MLPSPCLLPSAIGAQLPPSARIATGLPGAVLHFRHLGTCLACRTLTQLALRAHVSLARAVAVHSSTHAIGGLSMPDLVMAAKIDAIEVDYSPKWLREHGTEALRLARSSGGGHEDSGGAGAGQPPTKVCKR